LAFFFLEKELSILLTNKMRSDVLKPIFPSKHRNLNAKSKESSGIESGLPNQTQDSSGMEI
jgi:hypothetical protein